MMILSSQSRLSIVYDYIVANSKLNYTILYLFLEPLADIDCEQSLFFAYLV